MKLFIVTGASKGLGEALLRRLMQPGHTLVGMARSDGEPLQAQAESKGAVLRWIRCDMNDISSLDTVMEEACAGIAGDGLETAVLINNAGMVEPIAPADVAAGAELARNLTVNLIAPVVLTSAFLRLTAGWGADKRILNLSSGAGKKPYAGWSAYCASKAGLDMFTRCVGEEQQADGAAGVRILSVAPGVVDTGMQEEIRRTDPALFQQHSRFVQLKETGALASPDETAGKLLRVLFDDRYPTGSLLDVRELE
jgi:benzil reductase ((S)-benzoin forming)